MNSFPTLKHLKVVVIVGALFSTSWAYAGPSADSPEMKTALAKAQQGPDALRWYVQRTKTIYALDYEEVMSLRQAAQTAQAEATVELAQTKAR